MRKCPNCQKAVPDGARRCVYCRSIVDVVERTEDYEEGLASQTYMGLTSRAMRDTENVRDRRRETLDDEEELNNHTLLGIRGVAPSLGNRPSRHTDKVPPQSTMVGLPGIVPDMSLSASKMTVRDRSEQRVAAPAPATQEEDPLAGLTGVAQKNTVSSLIEEEFEDLSTEILGISFEEGELDEIDNEWFDFEFGAKDAPAPETQKQEAVRKTPSAEMRPPVQESKPFPKTEDRRDATVLPLVEEIQPLNKEAAERVQQKTVAPSAPSAATQERNGSELKELKRKKKISVPETLSVAASLLIAVSLIVPSPVGMLLTQLSEAGTFQYFYVFTAVSALALIPIQISGKFTPLVKALVSVALCVLTIVCITKSVWATYMPQSLFLFAATALFIVSALILSVKKI